MPLTANDEKRSERERFDYLSFISKHSGAALAKFEDEQVVYAQGDSATELFYIIKGVIKISVVSDHGKEGVLAILGDGDFFGERCLDGHNPRPHHTSAVTASVCEIVRIGSGTIRRAVAEDQHFFKLCMSFLLDRNRKLQADLIDQLFSSSEKRLARILLTLASIGLNDQSNIITIPITQETLASMVGTTRSRVSQFMTKFRKLGYIDYNGHIEVHNSLLNIILDNHLHDNTC